MVPEDANQTCGQFHSKEARERRRESLKNRIDKFGMSDLEIEARRKGVAAMHNTENREKARLGIKKNYEIGISEKRKNARIMYSERMYNKLYTAKEIEGFERVKKIQTGKTMQQRLGKPDWIHPNKGKSAYEIYGDDWIFPKSKPFKIIINNIRDLYFISGQDFIEKTKFPKRVLQKMRKVGEYTVQIKKSNTNYDYNVGDHFEYIPITIEEYKNHIKNSSSGTKHPA
jgi:hypothetical protein